MVHSLRRRVGLVFALVGVLAMSVMSGVASAAQDYSSLTRGFEAELTAALPVALAAVGLFIGVILAYKVVRRVLRA